MALTRAHSTGLPPQTWWSRSVTAHSVTAHSVTALSITAHSPSLHTRRRCAFPSLPLPTLSLPFSALSLLITYTTPLDATLHHPTPPDATRRYPTPPEQAVFESLELKHKVIAELEAVLPAHAGDSSDGALTHRVMTHRCCCCRPPVCFALMPQIKARMAMVDSGRISAVGCVGRSHVVFSAAVGYLWLPHPWHTTRHMHAYQSIACMRAWFTDNRMCVSTCIRFRCATSAKC
jgi:hypothetical protein